MSEPPKSFMEELQHAQVEWVEQSNRWVLPNNNLERLVNLQNVRAELIRISSSTPIREDAVDYYAREICRARRKLFAIVVYGWGEKSDKCCKAILDLVDDKITDSDLPFDRLKRSPRDRNTREADRLYVKGHARCLAPSHRQCDIRALQSWSKKDIVDFARYQWMVLAPVFQKSRDSRDEIPHYELDDRTLMPFEEDHQRTRLLQGGYSEVWPVKFFAGHQSLYHSPQYPNEEPMLAIKRLYSSHESDFEHETEMLKALTNEKHRYLVELLATYKYNGKYHLLFPYADANLRSLWTNISSPRRSPETYGWALDQMTGLASGLVAIHSYKSNMAYNQEMGNPGITRFRRSARRNLVVDPPEAKFGRHGDLKPENILWSNKSGEDPSGILQIADFGLSRFHRFESKSRVDPKTVVGSASYIPPELSLEQLISRAYDIWSLGCVFLEFATWLLKGSAGLEDFTKKRNEIAPDGVEDDTFFSLVGDKAVVRGSVLDWIEYLDRSPCCSDMVHDLLVLLEQRLLVVDSSFRIKADELYMDLKGMLQKSQGSSEYLVGDNHRRRKK